MTAAEPCASSAMKTERAEAKRRSYVYRSDPCMRTVCVRTVMGGRLSFSLLRRSDTALTAKHTRPRITRSLYVHLFTCMRTSPYMHY